MTPVPANTKIYHITHVDNLAGIIASGGLKSDALMVAEGGPAAMIGMHHIKERRLTRLPIDCMGGAMVGACVPFYFCPRSVMLYIINRGSPDIAYTGGQRPIIHLQADLGSTTRQRGVVVNAVLEGCSSRKMDGKCDAGCMGDSSFSPHQRLFFSYSPETDPARAMCLQSVSVKPQISLHAVLWYYPDLQETVEWLNARNSPWAFSLSSAATFYAQFRADLSNLDEVDWEAVHANYWAEGGKSDRKQAEFLVRDTFPWELFRVIGVHSSKIEQQVTQVLQHVAHKPLVEYRPGWYY